jgi:uncharacterized protein YceK
VKAWNLAATLVLALTSAMSGSGCATVFITVHEWPRPGLYPGTRSDWHCIGQVAYPEGTNTLGVITPFFGSMDLLFSMVADTILLPLHAGLKLAYGSEPGQPTSDLHR